MKSSVWRTQFSTTLLTFLVAGSALAVVIIQAPRQDKPVDKPQDKPINRPITEVQPNQEQRPDQSAIPAVTVRYLCFLVTPKAGATSTAKLLDPAQSCFHIFLDLAQDGSAVVLDPSGEAFLNALRQRYPNCTFRKDYSGSTVPDQSSGVWEIHRRDPADNCEVRVDGAGTISGEAVQPDGSLMVNTRFQAGMSCWNENESPGGGFSVFAPCQRVDHTYAMAQTGPGSYLEQVWPGTHILVACLLPVGKVQ